MADLLFHRESCRSRIGSETWGNRRLRVWRNRERLCRPVRYRRQGTNKTKGVGQGAGRGTFAPSKQIRCRTGVSAGGRQQCGGQEALFLNRVHTQLHLLVQAEIPVGTGISRFPAS